MNPTPLHGIHDLPQYASSLSKSSKPCPTAIDYNLPVKTSFLSLYSTYTIPFNLQ